MENYLIIILRTLIGFFTFFILMRFMGKREVGQLSLFDLIIILSIADLMVLGIDGFDDDLFELATICFQEGSWGLCDIECIPSNPVGYLTNYEVMEYLYEIKKFIEGEDNNGN